MQSSQQTPSLRCKNLHVYFGGSFDPPHLGHEQMLEALLLDPLSEHVHLVPTYQNPLKIQGQTLSAEKKENLMQLWTQSLQKKLEPETYSKLHLELRELHKAKACFTIDTLLALKGAHQGPWALSIGSDLLSELARWHEVSELLKQLHSVWIFNRTNCSNTLDLVPKELRALTHWRWMNVAIENVSSTQIRQQAVDPKEIAKNPGLASFARDFYTAL